METDKLLKRRISYNNIAFVVARSYARLSLNRTADQTVFRVLPVGIFTIIIIRLQLKL